VVNIIDPTDVSVSTLLFFFSTLFFSLITYDIKKIMKNLENMEKKYYELDVRIQKLMDKYEELEKEMRMMKKNSDK